MGDALALADLFGGGTIAAAVALKDKMVNEANNLYYDAMEDNRHVTRVSNQPY